MRTEGVYTYLCECGTLFAVVSRFAVAEDYFETLDCPKCKRTAAFNGEGFINHETNKPKASIPEVVAVEVKEDIYPDLLNADHVSEIIGVSKRVAYEIMERKDFPLIRLQRSKRVRKEKFYEWLNNVSDDTI